jgi:hypothetical protein
VKKTNEIGITANLVPYFHNFLVFQQIYCYPWAIPVVK